MIETKFNLCVSLKSYTHKPTRKECKDLRFKTMNLNIEELQKLIEEGFAYTSPMKDNWRCGENFVCSHVLTYDIDHCKTPITTYIENLGLKPTLAYTSSSNGTVDGEYSFRLVYLLSDEICSMGEYEVLSKAFAKKQGLTFLDKRSWKGDQMWFGCKGCETFTSDTVVGIDYIRENVNLEINPSLNIKKRDVTKGSLQKCHSLHNYTLYHYGVTDTFQKDYESMTFQEFIKKYLKEFKNVDKTPIEMDEDEPIVHYPQDYFEIRRPWKRINGEVLKIKDGERRRLKLFLNGVIRRKINPSITFENLLFCLTFEFECYYINNGNTITKRDIWNICESVMKVDINQYNDLGRPKYKSFVNPLYCKKYGMTPKQVLGDARNKKKYIGEFYDPLLSDKENIEVMKELGFDVSVETLKRWRKENGIKKYKK